MELDKRIIEGKRPLTCIDIEQAKEFVGKLCLFSDSYVNYKNIREYEKCPQYTGILHIVEDAKRFHSEEDYIFRNETDGYLYSLVLPLEWVKPEEPEKKYRPYTADEFIDKFEFWIGRVIRVRDKKSEYARTQYEYKTVFTGYRQCIGGIEVFLNGKWYTMHTLLGSFEYMENNEWKPFGVIDEDKE